jgi:hypothetical protein
MDGQHAQTLWIRPEKSYTLADLEPLHNKIRFALDTNTHFFIIMEHADSFSMPVANSLLKIIEEPPAGYHIILLAQRSEQILPTIKSRCIIQTLEHVENALEDIALVQYFKNLPLPSPIVFLQTLDATEMNEIETNKYIDQLLMHWQAQPETILIKKQIITLLSKALLTAPMPGSSKQCWKNLYLQMQNLV